MQPFRVLLPLLLAAGSLNAQSFLPESRVNSDSAGTKQIAPRVVVDSAGTIHVAWSDFRTNPTGDIYLATSTDRGVTFSPGRGVITGGRVPSGMQRGVQMAVSRSGTLHLVWMVMETLSESDVLYARSTDGGVTFSPPRSIAGAPAGVSQDLPSLTAVGDTLYVAFVDNREVMAGGGKDQLYFTRSTDDGQSFTPPIRASYILGDMWGSCECCNTSIAALPSGQVAISFRGNVDNNRDITVARSFDGGLTFGPSVTVAEESWFIPACPMTGSSIALDGNGTAHVVWRDSRPSANGKDYIYYTTLRAGESSAAPDRIISGTTSRSNFPSIAVLPNGFILAAYQDNRNDAGDIFAVLSRDGGLTFETDERLQGATATSGRQEEVTMTVAPSGDIYAVWVDARRDAGDILFARDTTTARLSASVPSEQERGFALQPHPLNRFHEATISLRLDGGHAQLLLHDLRGIEVYRTEVAATGETTLPLPAERLAPGLYLMTVRVDGEERARRTVVVE